MVGGRAGVPGERHHDKLSKKGLCHYFLLVIYLLLHTLPTALTQTIDDTYFRCGRDFCKKNEQYCERDYSDEMMSRCVPCNGLGAFLSCDTLTEPQCLGFCQIQLWKTFNETLFGVYIVNKNSFDAFLYFSRYYLVTLAILGVGFLVFLIYRLIKWTKTRGVQNQDCDSLSSAVGDPLLGRDKHDCRTAIDGVKQAENINNDSSNKDENHVPCCGGQCEGTKRAKYMMTSQNPANRQTARLHVGGYSTLPPETMV